jgi:hypothetical protein
MGAQSFYNSIQLHKVNEIVEARLQNITTADRTTLGSSLNSGNKGLVVFDTDLNAIYVWSGSAWVATATSFRT